MSPSLRALILALTALLVGSALAGCAGRIPGGRYGVRQIHLEGVEDLDAEALRACLGTRARSRFHFSLGTSADLDCGEPPFDGGRIPIRLWSWPWSEWPLLDLAILERDLQRVVRWYRARGYYDARVESARVSPEEANESDRIEEDDEPPCDPRRDGHGCPVEVTIRVEEGEPVLVREVRVELVLEDGVVTRSEDMPDDVPVGEAIDTETEHRLLDALAETRTLRPGARLDEAYYDADKSAMLRLLHGRGYACAIVEGQVDVDPDEHIARVRYIVTPGNVTSFGETTARITGEGSEGISPRTIVATADIPSGAPYDPARITDAQQAVYSLGPFASVSVEATPSRDDDGRCAESVDVHIEATTGRRSRWGVGGGVQSGALTVGTTNTDVQLWDIHLLAFYEHRNLLGGLRRLRIEDRPKVVFRSTEEGRLTPAPGNQARVLFRQPAFLEPRTTLEVSAIYDIGPDPNQLAVIRHDLDGDISVSRPFLDGRLRLSLGVHANLYRVWERFTSDDNPASDFHVIFWQQQLQYDLRNDPRNPRRGAYFALETHEAGYFAPGGGDGNWDYIRFNVDARAYAPLPRGIVIASRFSMGGTFLQRVHDDAITDQNIRNVTLGPARYRFYGGGSTTHRGYPTTRLGDLEQQVLDDGTTVGSGRFPASAGGTARWLGSLELRVPVGADVGLVFFSDVGDVSQPRLCSDILADQSAGSRRRRRCEQSVARLGDQAADTLPEWRFFLPRLTLGFGVRYHTIVGPLRVDFGWRVPRFQSARSSAVDVPNQRFPRIGVAGFHVTIGEAF